jgi:hypothetical protein
MKTIINSIVVIVILLVSNITSAQTLDSSNFLFKGLQTNVYSKLYDFAAPDTGYNIVWDYASNSHEYYGYNRFTESRPDNCFGSTYPDFDYSTYFVEYDSADINFGRFYRLKESGLFLDGILDCGSGFTLTESIEIPLPISYRLTENATSIDDYHGDPVDSKYQVNSSFEVIGYGTLSLPENLVYENAFLVKTTTERYRTEYDGFPSSGDSSIAVSYKWYNKDVNTSILSYNGGNRATYLTSSILNNVIETTSLIKPNIRFTPSHLIVTSNYNNATLIINDVLGRVLLQQILNKNVSIPISKLPKGVLFVNILIDGHVFTEKLLKPNY